MVLAVATDAAAAARCGGGGRASGCDFFRVLAASTMLVLV
jgi:hypothetical protein